MAFIAIFMASIETPSITIYGIDSTRSGTFESFILPFRVGQKVWLVVGPISGYLVSGFEPAEQISKGVITPSIFLSESRAL